MRKKVDATCKIRGKLWLGRFESVKKKATGG